ncbi:MAG TPA: hypothetical protein PKD64_19930, partial [Pirellulaceae bacterium]|nr:hypothetical protein [Pirellulaceae bacterium]
TFICANELPSTTVIDRTLLNDGIVRCIINLIPLNQVNSGERAPEKTETEPTNHEIRQIFEQRA